MDKKGSWEMGLKLESIVGSRVFFLIKGSTTACLKAAGIRPEVRDVLIKVKTVGPMESKTSLRRREGTQFEGQLVDLRWETTSEREERDMG